MDKKRRAIIKGTFTLSLLSVMSSLLVLTPKKVMAAWPTSAFAKKTLGDAIDEISYGATIKSNQIEIHTPNHIENGSLVPISISTDIKDINNISIFVEKNKQPLCASFDFTSPCDGYISTRIKMRKTSNIIVTVQAKGKSYQTKKYVKITKNDC